MLILKDYLAVLLCASLVFPPTAAPAQAAQAEKAQKKDAVPRGAPGQMEGDVRILHALNRFTFGPRPGDVEAVRNMGLDRWFEAQLHPERIADPGLVLRLAEFPALKENAQELLYRLPSNAVIRQAIDGKAPEPEDGVLHAIYANQMARVAQRKQEKQQAAAAKAPEMGTPAEMKAETNAMVSVATAAATEDETAQASLMKEILNLPSGERVGRLAQLDQAEFDGFRKALRPAQRAALAYGMSPAEKEQLSALENPQRTVVEELTAERLARDIDSSAQIEEVMTDFWLNHFNVFLHKNEETPYYLVSYERDVIRPRALGKFEELLEATAHSPAMLLYLDNASSMGPDSPAAARAKLAALRRPEAAQKQRQGLNENYARELMELHTLGVNGGYTQSDVTEVARILTGWGVDRPQRGGGFKFDENRHEPGTKKVMKKKFKEHGEQEGRDLLHMLATRPATARFLSRKLAIRFVGDDPPQPLVDRMAKTYLSSGGDIAAVLRTLFHSPEFWAPGAYRDKVKTPLEFVVSAARASNAEIQNYQPLLNALRDLGMPLYSCVPPTGYDWHSSSWVSTGALVNRMNFALALAANRLPGVVVDWAAGQAPADSTPESEEQRLEALLVAGGVSEATRSAVLEQFHTQTAQDHARPLAAAANRSALKRQDQLLAGLMLGSPEFQRR